MNAKEIINRLGGVSEEVLKEALQPAFRTLGQRIRWVF